MMWNRTSILIVMIIAAFLFTPTRASGQVCYFSLTVSGTVVDSLTNQPVAGVSVRMDAGWSDVHFGTDSRGTFRMHFVRTIACDWPEGAPAYLYFERAGYDSTERSRFFVFPSGGGSATWALDTVYLHPNPATGVTDELTLVSPPERFGLSQNYPNPFNPSTEIGFDLPRPSSVSLDISDILGREVTTLINEHLAAGSKQVQWNGRDNTGAEVASGVYFYRLRIGDHVEVKKMVLLR